MARFSPAEIRRYYDRNTSAFVTLGEGGSAIHRAVWGRGVQNSGEAFRYVEDRIAERIQRLPLEIDIPHIVDLGCGVGASLCYLARRLPAIRGTGITLSPVQARFAEEAISRAGLSGRVVCLEGDYCDLPAGLQPADLAYAIESFVHGPDPARFFEQCGQLIRPGGLLVVCDDFKRSKTDRAALSAIERFKRGWHINTLIDRGELQAIARGAGFTHTSTADLSPYLELNRPRDRAIRLLVALAGWMPVHWSRIDHLTGGSALQQSLERGWIGYDFAVFRRESQAGRTSI
jgi:cyclopropane fatty-acyl-phospholipid synthase-like methyltransferase